MNLDKVRARPFLLLMISDALESGALTQGKLAEIESQLVDMSLKIAKSFYSPVISHDLKKSCSIVMGVTTLGLLKLCAGDTLSARKILLEDSVVSCFRKGWESVNSLFKAHGGDADRAALLANYQYRDTEYKDIASIHESLMNEQLDINLLIEIAAKFKNPLSNMDMDPDYTDEISIKADVQLSIFEALMKRHAIAHTDYADFKALVLTYRDKADIFSTEFSEATQAILEKFDAQMSLRIEGWFASIEDDFKKIFQLLSVENSGPEIYISIFNEILRGNINAKKFMHAYESLLKAEKQLHPNLKQQIDVEYSFQNLLEAQDSDLSHDDILSELSHNITDDNY
ncbi:MAG: hypothetical protein OFPI_02710 [Osedax symbiont Rs2]|nr:MAG: hypothetical protein OFPI_02710 [Osedax symbiont Rs2]